MHSIFAPFNFVMHKMLLFTVQVSRFLFLVFLADLGKLGGVVNVAVSKVCLVALPLDTLHPSALNLSVILFVEQTHST